jgi:hypothetical protein
MAAFVNIAESIAAGRASFENKKANNVLILHLLFWHMSIQYT